MKHQWLIFLFCLANQAFAQDIHWTQFNNNPIFQNPAGAGNFKEDLRLTANYRTQWRSVSIPFQTTAIAGDTKWNNFGIGLNYFHDQVGDGKFQTNEFQLSICKPFALNEKQALRPAIQIGFNQRQLNSDAFYFDSQYNGYIFDPTAPTNESFQTASMTKPMLGFGLIHQVKLKERTQLQTGLGLFNLTRPNQSFFSDNTQRDIRVNLFSQFRYHYTDLLIFEPSIQFNFQGTYRELTLGGTAQYLFSKKEQITLNGGLWWRAKDAICLQFGMTRGPLATALSYDFNYSSLVPASRGRGAFEISVSYVFSKFRTPSIQYRICPDFI